MINCQKGFNGCFFKPVEKAELEGLLNIYHELIPTVCTRTLDSIFNLNLQFPLNPKIMKVK